MSGSQQLLLGGNPQAVPVDPYFYSVTSLLHGDGTNGGQNNTFLDSSSNNFTITRNGNTTQGSFSPFSQTGWSNYFDGTGDYLTSPNNAAVQLDNSTAFTLECWFNAAAFANQNIFRRIAGSAPFAGYGLATGEGGAATNTLVFWDGSAWRTVLAGLVAGQWYHFAATYEGSGTTLRFFVNGIQQGSALTCPAGISNTADTFAIGAANAGTAPFTGYVSNLRIVKGTAVYTSNFTVPTTPLTAITNTSLLTCQANRFLDASSNNFTITRNGDVSVQSFSPFNPITAYSTSAVGGSGYFDGSGDYLSVTNSNDFDTNTTFTLECWIYQPAAGTGTFFSRGGGNSSNYWSTSDGYQFILYISGGTLYWQWNNAGSATSISGTAPAAGAWHHVVVGYNGTTTRMWLDGASVGTSTTAYTLPTTRNRVYIGAETAVATNLMNGYIAGLRFVQGTDVYGVGNTSISVPTAPPTAVTNTKFLANFTNGAIFDNAAVADYETVGNAQISTSVKKYGTGSMAFDGTGDYLLPASNQNFAFRTGDFTVEYWIYTNSSADDGIFQLSTTAGGFATSYTNGMMMAVVSGVLYYALGGSSVSTGLTINNSTWYHIAMCRTSGVLKIYVNGTPVISTANTTDVTATNLVIGGYYSSSYTLVGYIDDFRISQVSRYPYGFTPPTAEFPNIGGTVTLTADPYFDYTTLLLPGNGTNGAQNNTFLDSSTNAFSITRNGNTTQGTFSPFSQTGWGNYFDGTGDYLTTNATQAIPATGDFTVDGWIWCNSYANGPSIISQGTAGTSGRTVIYITTAGKLALQITSTINEFGSAIPTNQWVYFAITRTGSTVTAYMNDTSLGTATNSGSIQNTTLTIGGEWNGDPYRWVGYLSNIRVSNVVRTITAAPTAAFTSDANTVVLTCQSNRFIDASSNAYTITRNGDVSVQAFSPFNPTAAWSAATNGGSGYFDGSGDYLTAPDNAALDLSGDFTVEAWIYLPNVSGDKVFFFNHTTDGNGIALNINNATPRLLAGSGGSWLAIATSAISVVPNAWYHIAGTRSGNTYTIWVNGVSAGTATSSGTPSYSSGAQIGRFTAGNPLPFVGYLSSLRVVKGTAVYTSTFTVPTAPLTAIANTSLLLNFTNAGIYDATSKNDLETVGNAQISTTQSKFGGSSMYFDGTGDYLVGPWNPLTDLGAGDFTIEFWMYPTAVGQSSVTYLFYIGTSGNYAPILIGQAASGYGIVLYSSSTGSSWNLASGSSFGTATANAWNHVALTRYGADVRLFLNGAVGTTLNWGTTALLTGSSHKPNIGSATGVANTYYTGYMQDLRVTKGIARYTSNFTPPTTAFLTL